MRCPKGTRKNKKTGKCEKKLILENKINLKSTNKEHSNKHNNNIKTLALTMENLQALNQEVNQVSASMPKQKAQKEKVKRKMSDTQRSELIKNYQNYWNSFINDENDEIYTFLRKIAKKQYSKDPELAKYEEEFYQHFIANDKMNNLYSERWHNYLIRLRKRAESDEKLTDAEKAMFARLNARAMRNNKEMRNNKAN